jgi:hypothetical protein
MWRWPLVIRRKSSCTSHEQSLFDLACTIFPFPVYLWPRPMLHSLHATISPLFFNPHNFGPPSQAITLSSHIISPFSGTFLCIGGNIFLRHTPATLVPDNIHPPLFPLPLSLLQRGSRGPSLPARFHLHSRDIYLVVCRRP